MTTLEELRRRILEYPEEDTHRLAYADELDNQDIVSITCQYCNGSGTLIESLGNSGYGPVPCRGCKGNGYVQKDTDNHDLAEFIRIQCGLIQPSERYRVENLRQRRYYEWIGSGLASVMAQDVKFTRGFVSEFKAKLERYVEHATSIFLWSPIEKVILSDVSEKCRTFYCGPLPQMETPARVARLPPELFLVLEGIVKIGPKDRHREGELIHIASHKEAQRLLHKACILYGKKKAGLTV